jgi:hypothetical protein
MSDRDDTSKPNQQIPVTQPEQPAAPTPGRRLFFFKAASVLAAAAVTAAGAAVVTATPAQAQRCTDRDPYDPRGRGRWCRRYRRRVTDNDPYDPRGRGRGW